MPRPIVSLSHLYMYLVLCDLVLVITTIIIVIIIPEYVDHLLSSRTPLAATMYKQRHDRIRKIIHWSILKHFNNTVSHNYWDHVPASVVETNNTKVLWDFKIYIDHFITARCPDIVVIDNEAPEISADCGCFSSFRL